MRLIGTILFIISICLSGVSVKQNEKDSPTAKEKSELQGVVEPTNKAMKERNVNNLVKIASVPWYQHGGKDQNRIIKNTDELRSVWKSVFFT